MNSLRVWAFFLFCSLTLCGAATPPPLSAADAADDEDEMLPVAAPKSDPALAKYWEALKLLEGGPKSPTLAAGRAALQSAADLESTHAQVLLAGCHLNGTYGFKEDRRKAANLFRLAAARGNGFARVSLGVCFLNGIGVSRSEKSAAEWLNAALALDADFARPTPPADYTPPLDDSSRVVGDQARDPANVSRATAHFLLGIMAAKGQNPAVAQKHYLAAAHAGPNGRDGLYPAALQAALNYAFGEGIPRDPEKASELLALAKRLSARAGVSVVHNYSSLKIVDDFAVADLELSVEAHAEMQERALQSGIAQQFADRKSKKYDPAEAVRWYELAAENGQGWAMMSLALLLSQPETPVHDPVRAFHWFERAGGGEKPKSFLAAVNFALCLHHGWGTTADPQRAAGIFERYRHKHFIAHLGATGRAPKKLFTEPEVVDAIKAAVKQKDPYAEYFLAARHAYGAGVPLNTAEAVKLLERAVKAAVPEAMVQLGVFCENTPFHVKLQPAEAQKRAATLYRQASDAGLAEASVNFAYLAANGIGMNRDLELSERYYLRALQQDPQHARACNNLGAIYQERLDTALRQQETEKAATLRASMISYLEKAMELDFGLAAWNLGDIFREGRLVARDDEKAYGYYDRASTLGITEAHYVLGLMHEQGEGVPVTPTEAAYHYRLAALAGHPEAMHRLISYYLSGSGPAVNLDRAVFWVRYALANTFDSNLLLVFCDVLRKREDYATLVPLLRNLTESPRPELSGYANSQLSEIYRDGLGVKPNPRKAKKHAEKAAKLLNGDTLTLIARAHLRSGNIDEGVALMRRASATSKDAKFFLAQMLYFGTHVEKDEAQAIALLHRAANENQSRAQYFLAGLTLNRAEGAPSLDDAIQFASSAEKNGQEGARDLRQKLENRRRATAAN